jgi:hypothetical protein
LKLKFEKEKPIEIETRCEKLVEMEDTPPVREKKVEHTAPEKVKVELTEPV